MGQKRGADEVAGVGVVGGPYRAEVRDVLEGGPNRRDRRNRTGSGGGSGARYRQGDTVVVPQDEIKPKRETVVSNNAALSAEPVLVMILFIPHRRRGYCARS